MSLRVSSGRLVFRRSWPPAKPPVLPFQDTPEQGVAVLRALGGKLIDLTFSETSSWSKSRNVEVQRTVTEKRVYQKNDDGTVEKENFVDVEEVTAMTTRDQSTGVETKHVYAKEVSDDNILILRQDIDKINKDLYENAPKVDDDREPNVG
jgi:hypothetical protein